MYLSHFGLREKPFGIPPSPRFMFHSETHDEGLARICYGLQERRGFVVVSGRVGLGKTTLMLAALEQLEGQIRSAIVLNPPSNFEDLLRTVVDEFGIDQTAAASEHDLLRGLNVFLLERHAAGETCVLLIDEAQHLGLELLERLRLLSNLQTESASLLQVVLIGQPELLEKLDDSRLEQFRQRVGVWHEIQHLDDEEVRSYIWHRLRMAGAAIPEKLISDDCCAAIRDHSRGIPRLINQLCDTALVIAYGNEERVVSLGSVEIAARELRLIQAPPAASVATPEPRSPAPRRHQARSWIWAAILITIVLIAAAWASQNRDAISDWMAQSPPTADAANAPAEQDPPTPAVVSEAVDDGRLLSEELQHSYLTVLAQAEANRDRGHGGYSVHLASFQQEQSAREFALESIRTRSEEPLPIYIEPMGDWIRVLVGCFDGMSDARLLADGLRQSPSTSFAQPRKLSILARGFEPETSEIRPAQLAQGEGK